MATLNIPLSDQAADRFCFRLRTGHGPNDVRSLLYSDIHKDIPKNSVVNLRHLARHLERAGIIPRPVLSRLKKADLVALLEGRIVFESV